MRRFLLGMAAALFALGTWLPASAQGLRDRLKGLVYEVEEYTEPKDAWLPDRSTPDHWNLWSTEEDVINKRSGGRSLQSPRVEQDRATPEEGAPPLRTRITGIPRGTYRVFAGPPNRRIAISFDGKNWEMRQGGEVDLGVATIQDGTFEVWVDDRYANPGNIGSCYYDYIRFEEFTPPRFSRFAAFGTADARARFSGAGAPPPGAGSRVQLSWITDTPVPTGTVEYGQNGRFDRKAASAEVNLRNHRVVLPPLPDGAYQARVRITFGRASFTSPVFPFQVRAALKPRPSQAMRATLRPYAVRVTLTVAEPTAYGRKAWPVTSGVPFPRGALFSPEVVRLVSTAGAPVPAHFAAASWWPDGSIRWLTATFLADTDPAGPTGYTLEAYDRAVGGRDDAATSGAGNRGASRVQTRTTSPRRPILPLSPHPLTPSPPHPLTWASPADGLFRDLALDANGDGEFALDERMTAEPALGNVRVVDAAGKAYGMAPGATIRTTQDGLRRETVAEGAYTGPEGDPFRWRAEMAAFAGQPWVRVRFTVGNAHLREPSVLLDSAALRLPLIGDGPLQGAFDGDALRPVPDADSFALLQDRDDHFALKAGGAAREGEHSLGLATARRGDRQISVFVKDFWQTYPKGLAIKPDGLHIRLLPTLPEDAYARESEDTEALIRLYYPFEKGKCRVPRGMEFTTELYVLPQSGRGMAEGSALRRYAEWFQHPLFAAASPQAYCASGALGVVAPRAPGRFDAYEGLVERGLQGIEAAREQRREYGYMNYGDWHGERHFNWGNLEYDLPWALGLAFARTGDHRFLWRGEQAAKHLATTDTVHYPWSERMPGLVWLHCVGHTGGFFGPRDERFRKLGNVFGLRDPEADNPFVKGAIDAGGHIVEAGSFLYGLLLGEPRLVEVAESVVGNQAAYMTPDFRFGIERAAGWPIVNALEAYETTGNPFYLNAARLYVEKVLAQQDPTIGDFRMRVGPPECLHDPPHVGGKAFAAGILLYGLMRYHQVTAEPAVKTCIVRAARWLARDSWNPETHAFRYISTCPTFDSRKGNGATDLAVAPGLAYALTLQQDAQVRSVLLDSLSRAVRAGAGDGKSYAMEIRQAPHAFALLRAKLGITALPDDPGASGVQARAEVRAAPGTSAPFSVLYTNGTADEVTFAARAAALPAGWEATPERVEHRQAKGTRASPAIRLMPGKDAVAGEATINCAVDSVLVGRLKVRLVPVAPAVLAPAPEASGLGVIGDAENPTVKALAGLPGVTTGISADDVARFRAVALACDHFAKSTDKPGPLFERLGAYARGGGSVVLFQLNDDMWQPGFLSFDLALSDTNGEVGSSRDAAHPLFAGVGPLSKVVCYDTVTFAGPEWKVLARDAAGGPAILEAAAGKGRILLVEPSVDRIACAAEPAPEGVDPTHCRRFVANLARYALGR